MTLVRIRLLGLFAMLVSLGSGQIALAPSGDVAQHAVEQSKLALPGSVAFHLKAKIVETTNPASEYKGEIEEYWITPEKWRRTITSPAFSQTLIVNGGKISEVDDGDYFPWWLNDLATAIFDPLPMLQKLQQENRPMPRPIGTALSTACGRQEMKVGTPPAVNSAFSVICFGGTKGLLESVVTPGYSAQFDEYKNFKGKQVARRIAIDPESGTHIEAKITELAEINNPDENMFVAPATSVAARIDRIVVSDATLRKLSQSTPEIVWPSVRSGKTSGVLSMYVSVDRDGHVREAWPLNSDNAGLEDTAREQVKKWQFKPATSNGVLVQVEAILTFAFSSKIGDPIPILSDAEARKLASNLVEPVFPPGSAASGTEVKVQIGVSLDGTVNGVGNPYNVPTQLFMAAVGAVRQWHFRPYLRDGKPDLFGADIVFHVP